MVLLCLLLASPTQALRPKLPFHPDPCFELGYTAEAFRDFSADVWLLSKWERGRPLSKVIQHQRVAMRCIGVGDRRALRATWRQDQRAFFEHRRAELWRSRVTPYRGGGRAWAVPFPIVVCESGVRGYVTSGYYGILISTWAAFGGVAYAPTPGEAPKRAQDLIAHKLIRLYGLQPWECAGLTGLA